AAKPILLPRGLKTMGFASLYPSYEAGEKGQTMTTPLAAKIAREYGTPCAVIDMDRVERNIARIQKACDEAGIANRPHIKTHKNPMLAQLQIKAGAKGITCQKLGEAE